MGSPDAMVEDVTNSKKRKADEPLSSLEDSKRSSRAKTTSDLPDASAEEPLLKPGSWYLEKSDLWPGRALALEVKEVLLEKRTPYQQIKIFESTNWGKVLLLDGIVQLTERDEPSYHEMIAHIPLFSHPNPEKVLIVGGGDGGVLREVVKHSSVKKVTMCEIDKVVIEQSKTHFPTVSTALKDMEDEEKNNGRVQLYCGDAAEFVKENLGQYDVIICDSSDPIGPAEPLFKEPFYRDLHACLRPGGVACTQAECIWNNLELITEDLIKPSRKFFADVRYASTQVPTYPCGQIGFVIATKANDDSAEQKGAADNSISALTPRVSDLEGLKYYSNELHKAAFVLPKFVVDALK